MLIYAILKVLVRIALRVFYRKVTIHGREHLALKGPLLVASNHPNTLMDVLAVASVLRQRTGFVGNASLFRTPWVAKVLTYFHVIPIYRKQDLRPGEEMTINDDSFRKAYDYLAKRGVILLFPEGTSFSEKKLREIRTGVARIALGYEAKHQFQGQLKIITTSLNYSSPRRFRTRLHLNINPPIDVADFAAQYAQDDQAAVRALTQTIEQRLSAGLVILDDKPQERMFQQLIRLYNERLEGPEETERPARATFAREKHAAEALRRLRQDNPLQYEHLRTDLDRWFSMLDRIGLRQSILDERMGHWPPLLRIVLLGLFLLPAFPFALFGLIMGAPLYTLPAWLAPKLTHEVEYHAPIMMMAGLLLFPLIYGLETLAFYLIWAQDYPFWYTLIFAALLPATGFLALLWADAWARCRALFRLLSLGGNQGSVIRRLQKIRTNLLHRIESLL